MGKLEKEMARIVDTNRHLEYLNTEKDTFYDHLPMRFIAMIEDSALIDPLNIDIKPRQVEEANVLFGKTFEFYGGYAQLSANAKDQVGESLVLEQYQQTIANLKAEIAAKDGLLEAANMGTLLATQGAEEGNAYTESLEKEIKRLNAYIASEAKRHLEVKRKLYDEF